MSTAFERSMMYMAPERFPMFGSNTPTDFEFKHHNVHPATCASDCCEWHKELDSENHTAECPRHCQRFHRSTTDGSHRRRESMLSKNLSVCAEQMIDAMETMTINAIVNQKEVGYAVNKDFIAEEKKRQKNVKQRAPLDKRSPKQKVKVNLR